MIVLFLFARIVLIELGLFVFVCFFHILNVLVGELGIIIKFSKQELDQFDKCFSKGVVQRVARLFIHKNV